MSCDYCLEFECNEDCAHAKDAQKPSEYDRLKKMKNEMMAREAVKITSCAVNKIAVERDRLREQLTNTEAALNQAKAEIAFLREALEKLARCVLRTNLEGDIRSYTVVGMARDLLAASKQTKKCCDAHNDKEGFCVKTWDEGRKGL